MKIDKDGFVTQEHAGESVAAAHANAILMIGPVGPNQFRCENCRGIFDKDQDPAVAESEYLANFGHIPEDEERATLCDDCYAEFMNWYRPTLN